MTVLLFVIVVGIIFGLLWSLPFYLVTNLVLWLFGASFRISIIQSYAVCVLLNIVGTLLFRNDEGGK